MCPIEPVFFAVVDVEQDAPGWRMFRKVFNELEQRYGAHPVIRGA